MQYLKRALFSLIFFFYFNPFCSSQLVLIPFRKGNLWGYADTLGVIQVKPVFDKADFFNYTQNFSKVFKNNKVSLMNHHGKLLFPFSDKYEQYSDYYIVKQNGKKGIYTRQGIQLHGFEYSSLECPCYYELYKKESDKMIGLKNNEFYLVDLKSKKAKKITKPIDSRGFTSGEGLSAVLVDEDNLTTVPYPQRQSRDFPKLNGYSNLVHCETIFMNQKPVFYVFCIWKDGKKNGYIGQNGVVFYKD